MRIPVNHVEVKVDLPTVVLLQTQGYRSTDRDNESEYRWRGRRWTIARNSGKRGDVQPLLEACEELIPASVVRARENSDHKVLLLLQELKLRTEYALNMTRDAAEMRTEVKALADQIQAEMENLVKTSSPQRRRKLT